MLNLIDLRQRQVKQWQQASGILLFLMCFTDLYSPYSLSSLHIVALLFFHVFPIVKTALLMSCSPPFVPPAPGIVFPGSPLRCGATPWLPVSAAPETRKQWGNNLCSWITAIDTMISFYVYDIYDQSCHPTIIQLSTIPTYPYTKAQCCD